MLSSKAAALWTAILESENREKIINNLAYEEKLDLWANLERRTIPNELCNEITNFIKKDAASFIRLWFSDNELIDFIEHETFYEFPNSKFWFILGIRDEAKRLEYSWVLEFIDEREEVINTISDERKVYDYLTCTERDPEIVCYTFRNKFTSDYYILKYIMYYIENISRESVSLTNYVNFLEDENSIKKLVMFGKEKRLSSSVISSFIFHLRNKDSFIQAVLEFVDYFSDGMVGAIKSRLSEADIIKALEKVSNTMLKLCFVCALSDEAKKDYLDEFKIASDLININRYTESDDVKLIIISKMYSSQLKLSLAKGLKSDDFKLKALEYIRDLGTKIQLVMEFDEDKNKIDFINNNFLDAEDKDMIILSLKDRAFKFRYFDIKLKGMYKKAGVLPFEIYDGGVDRLPLDITFGSEIEVCGGNAAVIEACAGKLFESWDIKSENSISEKDGVEFSSPILHYKKKDLKKIYNVCHFSKGNNMDVNHECGGHLHFGSDYLDTIDAWFWLYYIYTTCEKLFYLISSEKEPRSEIVCYARPVYDKFLDFWNEKEKHVDVDDYIDHLQEMFGDKHFGINILNIGKRFNTIEFRVPNGTLDADVIVQNILLFGNLLRLAKNLSRLPLDANTHKLLMAFDSDKLGDKQRLELLLKLLFKEEKNREVFRKRYKNNLKSSTSRIASFDKRISLKGEHINI